MSLHSKVVFVNNDNIYSNTSGMIQSFMNYKLISNEIVIKIMFVHYAKCKKSGIYLNGVFSTYHF